MSTLAPNDSVPLIALGIKGALDSDDWAATRLAELRAAGERATAVVQWAPASPPSSGLAFAVKIRREDGSIESPDGSILPSANPSPVQRGRLRS